MKSQRRNKYTEFGRGEALYENNTLETYAEKSQGADLQTASVGTADSEPPAESTSSAGQTSLSGGPLQPCTQNDNDEKTGWDRSGSCNWHEGDDGYHAVCVTMSQEFLKNSAEKDGNDLSGSVKPDGHWCICAWAFASAVQRDMKEKGKTLEGLQTDPPEGLQLDCERTNSKLRHVYESKAELRGYELKNALAYLKMHCGGGGDGGGEAELSAQPPAKPPAKPPAQPPAQEDEPVQPLDVAPAAKEDMASATSHSWWNPRSWFGW